jgi:glycerate dehydrogenase
VTVSVVFLDAATYGDASLETFTSRWNCTIYPVTAAADLQPRLTAQAIAVTNKVTLDGAALGAIEARDLRLIAVAATGTDIIDKQAAKDRGIKICNVPGYAAHSVAQFTFALILELASRVGAYSHAVRRGNWQRSPTFSLLEYPTFELSGKTLGIVGYGNIGRSVAEIARGFGLKILIAARPGAAALPAGRVSLDQVFKQADIITLHCPLTLETQQL